jgi:hypothetical protein
MRAAAHTRVAPFQSRHQYRLRGDDNVTFHDGGDIYFNGEWLDNIHTYAPYEHQMKSKHQLAHASFTIYQDVEPPEFWTNYFAVVPDTAGIKGERFVTPSGRMSAGARRVGLWSISSQKTIQSDALTPPLRYLVERLSLPRADLPEWL